MTSSWASPEIVLSHGACAVRLRPSLRAAVQLERLHDGFATLFQKVAELDTKTVAEIITVAATDPREARAFLQHLGERPLRLLAQGQGPLLALCTGLIPTPSEDAPKVPTDAKPQPWADVFRQLFGFACGWLRWSPAEAWNATPTEITDAFAAHCDALKAIHGAADEDATGPSAEERAQNIAEGLDPDFDRGGLASLRGMGAIHG